MLKPVYVYGVVESAVAKVRTGAVIQPSNQSTPTPFSSPFLPPSPSPRLCLLAHQVTLQDNTVTLRHRDTAEQVRVHVNDVQHAVLDALS